MAYELSDKAASLQPLDSPLPEENRDGLAGKETMAMGFKKLEGFPQKALENAKIGSDSLTEMH